jgi:drug/metabolite transporter (DMT)-like permease
MNVVVLAATSGFFAAAASCCAKLATDVFSAPWLCSDCLIYPAFGWTGLSLASNGLMWACYTASLKTSNSSFLVSIYNTCANTLFTGLLGMFVFGETIALRWCFGVCLMLLGTIILGSDQPEKQKLQ